MKFIPAIVCLILLALPVMAQDEKAQHEIARRGNMVEMTGTIRSGLMAAALAHPEDDSAKWFITLVVKPNNKDSEYMRHVIETDRDMKPWVNAAEQAKSPTHYQVRWITDRTQADWLAGLKKPIDRYGLPCVVLQPPLSKQFGDPHTIVKVIHGTCSGKDLSEKLREAIIEYVQEIDKPQSSGIGGEPPYQPNKPSNSYKPPFDVQPPSSPPTEVAPSTNGIPFEYPAQKPKSLTPEDVEAACPGATPQFILDTVRSKETDLKIVKLQWQLYKSEHATKPPEQLTPEPEKPWVVVPPHEPEQEVANDQRFFYECPEVLGLILTAILAGWFGKDLLKLVRERIASNAAKAAEKKDAQEKAVNATADQLASIQKALTQLTTVKATTAPIVQPSSTPAPAIATSVPSTA